MGKRHRVKKRHSDRSGKGTGFAGNHRRLEQMTIPPYAREELERRWARAGIENDYIFYVVMQDPDIFLQLMQRILPELQLTRVTRHERQRTEYAAPDAKSVRYDVYSEINGIQFVVEMQMQNNPDLRRRTRYYQSMLDIQNLHPGQKYRGLPDSFVIMICPFDMFGRGRHLYRFRNIDIHDRTLELHDGADKIFLNAKGTLDDISPELDRFLDLVNGQAPADEYCQMIADSVDAAKRSVEVKRMFMNVNIKQMAESYYMEQEIRQRVEQEISERVEQETRERVEQEARERVEQETRERVEQEVRQAVERKVREEQTNGLRVLCNLVLNKDIPMDVAVRNAAIYGVTNEADLRKRAREIGVDL